ncbi:MAG: hypothetical protein JW839_08730 [Candidatus Lokiarchaeota archaeon]|nr:hypothetical protein [Candidatus Lokiarchaeota archaeon]
MNTLNIETPQNKTIFVVLTKKENNALLNEQRYNLCEEVLNEHSFDFVTVDMEGESKFNPKSLVKVIGKCPIESHGVDVPAFAAGYLRQEVDDKREQAAGLEKEYAALADKASLMAQNMASWIDVLKSEAQELESELEGEVKAKWLTKRILDIAANFTEDEVYVLHFGVEKYLPVLKAALTSVDNVKVSILDGKKQKTVSQAVFA